MKAFEFPGWASSPSNKGLLFFAQAMEEMLFHYGHDSLKVPALNFRFLCIEIQKTIKKINADIVDKGNMRPLLAELKDAFKKDPIAQRLFGNNFECLFFSKNADGEIHQDCSDIFKDPCSEASLKRINQVINYLLNEMQLIDTINIYAGKGYTSIKTIYTALQQKEYRYLRSLEKKEQNGSPKKIDEDFVAVIFGYIN